jgi:hypothetical protein
MKKIMNEFQKFLFTTTKRQTRLRQTPTIMEILNESPVKTKTKQILKILMRLELSKIFSILR